MAEKEHDPLVGQVLSGRFQILAPLGKGGMGRVYKALQTPLDRIVALKVLNPRYDSSKDPGFERRFFLEASMTAKLKHPNTITVHDYGRTDDGIFFIAMEYVEGDTLQQVLKREGRLAWPRALAVTGQIARSLREAHKLGLVHRDLKPANIMLTSEGTGGDLVKVLDFGLVKAFADEAPADAEITQAGVLLGSPMYMAPEQAKSESDPRSDIYSLGVVLYQTLCGKPPFEGKDGVDLIVRHIREPVPPLQARVPDLPSDVDAIVMKCLEKAPADRFQSMDALLEAMIGATSGQGLSGLFQDPRTMTGQAMPRVSVGAPRATPVPAPGAETRVEGVKSVEIALSSQAFQKKPPRGLVLGVTGLVLVCLVLGGLVTQRVWSKPVVQPLPVPVVEVPKPPVEPPPVIPPPLPKAEPAHVTFAIASEPQGATVKLAGAVVGVTPFEFSDATESPPLERDFELMLDGYEPASLHASGDTGTVPLKVSLKRIVKVSPAPLQKKPAKPDGYKDDPYQ